MLRDMAVLYLNGWTVLAAELLERWPLLLAILGAAVTWRYVDPLAGRDFLGPDRRGQVRVSPFHRRFTLAALALWLSAALASPSTLAILGAAMWTAVPSLCLLYRHLAPEASMRGKAMIAAYGLAGWGLRAYGLVLGRLDAVEWSRALSVQRELAERVMISNMSIVSTVLAWALLFGIPAAFFLYFGQLALANLPGVLLGPAPPWDAQRRTRERRFW
jgi:hypothetical protein